MSEVLLAVSLRCEPSPNSSKIGGALTKFLNNASEGLGGALSMVDNIDNAVGEISDAMEGLTTSMSDLLQNKLTSFILSLIHI